MSKSLIQDTKECFITGSYNRLERHHIFMGNPDRKLSEKYGLWVWLRVDYHKFSDYAVHNNRKLDLTLKRIGQQAFEDKYSHEEFMEVFMRNYL